MAAKIVSADDDIRLERKARVLDRQSFQDIQGIFVVQWDEIIPNDIEPLCLVLFEHVYWVIPYLSEQSAPFFIRLADIAVSRSLPIKHSLLPSLPWRWRKKIGGFLPLFPDPEVGVHLRAHLPDLTVKDIIDADHFKEIMR